MSLSISISKRWLLAYFIGLLGAVGLGWVYTMRYEPETQFWATAFEGRREEIGKPLGVSKVIFTGDSACAFAINPALFEEYSGLPAYNLGGTRQMGMRAFMNEALKHASEGDHIVLICNPQLLAAEVGREDYTKAGARMALRLAEEMKVAEFFDAARPGFSQLVSHAAKVVLRKPLFRYGEGDHGVTGQVTTSKRDHPSPSKVLFELEKELDDVAEVLIGWRDRCGESGVTLYYLTPEELTDEFILEENRKRKQALMQGLEARVNGVTFLQLPEKGCSDDESLFADTLFHLTEEAADRFTRKLTPVLAGALNN